MPVREKKFAIAYWLLPERGAREFFSRQIADLARRFQAEVFVPHLTICVLPESHPIKLPPSTEIVLRGGGIRSGDAFTKTLFVQFARSPELEGLAALIAKRAVQVDPHLSLLYQTLSPQTRSELVEEIIPPFREIRFHEICAVRCALPVESPADVRAWQRVAP